MTCSKVPKGTLPLGGWEGLDLPLPIDAEGTLPYCPSLSILYRVDYERGGYQHGCWVKWFTPIFNNIIAGLDIAPSKTQLAAGWPPFWLKLCTGQS